MTSGYKKGLTNASKVSENCIFEKRMNIQFQSYTLFFLASFCVSPAIKSSNLGVPTT